MKAYVPDAGDIVWLQFDPQAGHRPALVLSPALYNARAGLMLCCPLTTQIKGYPFEVPIAAGKPGAVLADQVKSVDWRARQAIRKGKATAAELSSVRRKALALIGQP